MEKILVTGASGNLGSAVAKTLANAGFAVVAASRKPLSSLAKGITWSRFDYEDLSTYEAALNGVTKIFLVAPPLDPEAPGKLIPFIDRAKTTKVDHIVFNSAMGADASEDSPLRKIERQVMNSGINYTILRPTFFMENFSTGFIAPMIKAGGIFLAADSGKTSFITVRDIADVAKAAFVKGLHHQVFTLTGPEALDHTQVAQIISKALGKTITYTPLPEEAMLKSAREHGMPEGAVQYMAMLYQTVRAGGTSPVTDEVKKTTGHAATSFAEFAQKAFRGA